MNRNLHPRTLRIAAAGLRAYAGGMPALVPASLAP